MKNALLRKIKTEMCEEKEEILEINMNFQKNEWF